MIEYVLDQYDLAGDPQRYRAHVVNSRKYTFDDIANHLLKHNTGLSGPVIYGVWEGIKGAVEDYLSEGGAVNTELFRVNASVRGVFNGRDDRFDMRRHRVRINMQPGSLLNKVSKSIKVKKRSSAATSFITSVTDVKSGSVNGILTPGRNIRILGSRVKINGDDPSVGLYFVPEKAADAAVRIEASEYVVNNPSEIIAVIPNLKKGRWKLRLVTQYTTGPKYRKVPRSLSFEKSLTVA